MMEFEFLCSLLMAEPNCFLQAHEGPAYDVKFYGHGEDSMLLRYILHWYYCNVRLVIS